MGNMMGFLGLAGAVFSMFYAKREQEKKDKEAWERYALSINLREGDPGFSQIKDAWESGRKSDRRERVALRSELMELKKILEPADEVVRVSVGLFKAQALLGDTSVPAQVRVWIMAHWLQEWNKLFHAKLPSNHKSLLIDWLELRLADFEAQGGKNGIVAYGAPTPEKEAEFAELAKKCLGEDQEDS